MMKFKKTALALLVVLAAWQGGAAAELQAVRSGGAINIDGRLNEKAWTHAPEYTDFKAPAGKPAPVAATSVKVLYDANALYLGIRCEEPVPSALRQAVRPRDGGLYELDSVEVMLDPAATQERYYHFMVSSTGDVFDQFVEQGGGVQSAAWNGVWKARTFVGKDFWSCEIKIPFYNFSEAAALDGDWLVNVCRNRRTNPRGDSSIAQGAYHALPKFPKLKGLDVDFKAYRIETKQLKPAVRVDGPGKLAVENTAEVANCADTAVKYTAESWLADRESGSIAAAPETRFELAPGERRKIELPRIPLARQGAYLNVLRIADASGRTVAYKDAAADIRFSPVSIRLDTPWYRHAIFATQKIKDVVFDVGVALPEKELAGKQLRIAVLDRDRPVYESSVNSVQARQRLTIAADKLPFGRFMLKAMLVDRTGRAVDFGSAETPLWKLPYKAGEVWLDRDGSIMREGKPFFFMTAHTSSAFVYPEFTLSYRNDGDDIADSQLWLASKIAFRREARLPETLKALQSGFMTEADLKPYIEQVKLDRDHPKLFGYYIYDEPSARSVAVNSLKQVYEAIRDADPYHPVVISDSPRNAYLEACDIQVHHPYPNVVDSLKNNDCRTIFTAMRSGQRMLEESGHKVAFVFMDMGFNKYDYGLGPRNGRMATFEEFRDHTIMAFAVGMKGVMPFNVSCEIYPEAVIGFREIALLAAWLGPYMNSASAGAGSSPDNPNLHTRWKTDGRDMVLAASNVSMTPGRYTVKLENLPAAVKSLQVVGEDRAVPVVNGAIQDDFAPCGGHVYTTGTPPKLRSKAAVEAEIEKHWQARRKPGNLLFRRFLCRDNTKVTASISQGTHYSSGSQDATLWHLTDGFFPAAPGGYGFWYWQVNADRLPAWVMFEFEAPRTVGRIVAYPMLDSIKKLTCEVEVNGAWREVGSMENFSGRPAEFKFGPESISKFRLNMLEINGKSGYIGEVEAFEK